MSMLCLISQNAVLAVAQDIDIAVETMLEERVSQIMTCPQIFYTVFSVFSVSF